MTEISSLVRAPPPVSPRTASYVAALIQEGDDFDYSKWLREARERRAKQTVVKGGSDERVRGELGNRGDKLECRDVWRASGVIPTIRTALFPIAFQRSRRKIRDETAEGRLTRRVEKICEAWNDFQSNRARDAVYRYLASVLAIVEHYKVRRKTRKLLQHAFEFADLPFDKSADPFTTIIRCTSETVDSKTISKWARALRYVARCKPPETSVKAFMKDLGGVNACADLYSTSDERVAASLVCAR